ncbi:MAG: DNA repair protein RecO [Deltaproteobacteria bacterium]|nr:MAG: DNA repair protein RecO [Deltaproteobacteria bacterium]
MSRSVIQERNLLSLRLSALPAPGFRKMFPDSPANLTPGENMHHHNSFAIVIRVREFGESDLLVTFFTPDRGTLKGVAKGGRKSRKRFPNCLDLLCLTKVAYTTRRNKDLCFLNSCELIHGFPGLRSDFTSLVLASHMAELSETLFPQNVPGKEIFDLLNQSFLALDRGKDKDIIRIVFEAKAMALAGYGINFEKCCHCGRPYTGTGRAIFCREKGAISCLRCRQESVGFPGMAPGTAKKMIEIQKEPVAVISGMELDEEAVREIKPVLRLHIAYRIGRPSRSVRYLE